MRVPTGATGSTGATGITGPTGPAGATEASIYLSNIGAGAFSPGASIEFNQPAIPILPVLGMSFQTPSTVRLSMAGEYSVAYTFRATTAGTTLALFLGDQEIPGSRYETSADSQTLTGFATFPLTPLEVPALVTLRNVHPTQSATLDPGTQPNVVDAGMTVTATIY